MNLLGLVKFLRGYLSEDELKKELIDIARRYYIKDSEIFEALNDPRDYVIYEP